MKKLGHKSKNLIEIKVCGSRSWYLIRVGICHFLCVGVGIIDATIFHFSGLAEQQGVSSAEAPPLSPPTELVLEEVNTARLAC